MQRHGRQVRRKCHRLHRPTSWRLPQENMIPVRRETGMQRHWGLFTFKLKHPTLLLIRLQKE